jgi:hypothetical protein
MKNVRSHKNPKAIAHFQLFKASYLLRFSIYEQSHD